jgi:uncharacterized membrane protein YdbT with pleckstrin-like domain
MSYVQDNLMPNEKVLYTAKISLAIFISPIIIFVMSIAFFIAAFTVRGQQNLTQSSIAAGFMCFGVVFLLFAILYMLQAIIIRLTTEFAVTNRRVIAKTGFIRRHTLEMLLQKIESVAVNQRIVERLLNYGTLTVTGTGGTKERFSAIASPFDVRKAINQIVEEIAHSANQQPGTAKPTA